MSRVRAASHVSIRTALHIGTGPSILCGDLEFRSGPPVLRSPLCDVRPAGRVAVFGRSAKHEWSGDRRDRWRRRGRHRDQSRDWPAAHDRHAAGRAFHNRERACRRSVHDRGAGARLRAGASGRDHARPWPALSGAAHTDAASHRAECGHGTGGGHGGPDHASGPHRTRAGRHRLGRAPPAAAEPGLRRAPPDNPRDRRHFRGRQQQSVQQHPDRWRSR